MDRNTQEELWTSVEPRIRRYVYRKYGGHWFEDNVQSALMQVWTCLSSFDINNPKADLMLYALKAANQGVYRRMEADKKVRRTDRRKAKKVRDTEETLRALNQYSLEAMIRETGMTEEEINQAKQQYLFTQTSNLNFTVSEEEDMTLEDCIPAPEKEDKTKLYFDTLLGSLPIKDQDLIRLHHYEQYSIREIAEAWNESEDALYSRHQRVIDKLRRKIYAEGQVDPRTNRLSQRDSRRVLSALL